jgi:hypothetical protein
MTLRDQLSEIAEVLKGTTPAHVTDEQGGPIFIGQSEVTSGGAGPVRFVDTSREKSRAAPVLLEPGDVVFASLDPSHHALVITKEHHGAYLGRECMAVRINQNWTRLTPVVLAAWAQSDDFRRQAEVMTSGITMPRLSSKSLAAILVPEFDDEQISHADRLASKFEAAIGAVRTTLNQLESLQSIEMDLVFHEESGE